MFTTTWLRLVVPEHLGMNTECGCNNLSLYGMCFVWLGREGLRPDCLLLSWPFWVKNYKAIFSFNPATLLQVWLPPSQLKVESVRVVFWGSPHRTTQHYDIGGVSAALVKQRHAPVAYACAWLSLGWLGTE